jgi:anti-sigma factor RsiW
MMAMRCTLARRRLSAYLDGALGEPQRRAIEDHLAGCPDCAAHAADLRRAWDMLGLSEDIGTSPAFVAGVMRRVQARVPQPVWQAPGWAVVAALIVCLACGGLVGLVQSGGTQSGPVPQLALATDVSRQLGIEAFGPSPADTIAGAYVQFTGSERGR